MYNRATLTNYYHSASKLHLIKRSIIMICKKTFNTNDNNTIIGVSLLSNGNELDFAATW